MFDDNELDETLPRRVTILLEGWGEGDPEAWRTRLNCLFTSIETFDAYRQAGSAEDVGKWQAATDSALMSQGGHNTGPHTDSHGMGK
ncbi:hypothetical protein FPRO04_05870 [Fusarium proliferatum]|nr:hypothetical protein FPRO04_05870 [Fusarium proliferatum]